MNKNIRNFCIIAHIDHGKSTLADRMLEITGTVRKLEHSQMLDRLDIEQERWITIKLTPARMQWKGHELNLIDTPGHVDFQYEVSRSLAAVEGAVLLVDASQGVQAQTLSVLYSAMDYWLEIIPVLNKIDLPAANPERVAQELQHLLGIDPESIIKVSWKTGENVDQVLDAIIERIEAPEKTRNKTLDKFFQSGFEKYDGLIQKQVSRALIFDSVYDKYRGVVCYVKVVDGSFAIGSQVRLVYSDTTISPTEVWYFTPEYHKDRQLSAGQIGYIVTGQKSVRDAKIWDTMLVMSEVSDSQSWETFTQKDRNFVKWITIPWFKKVKPYVYAGVYPIDSNDFEKLREAFGKLALNDSAVEFEYENSKALGYGFRSGFLGMLHMDIVKERLYREYNLETIFTIPSVVYLIKLKILTHEKIKTGTNVMELIKTGLFIHIISDFTGRVSAEDQELIATKTDSELASIYADKLGSWILATSGADMPEQWIIDQIYEPYADVEIVGPKDFSGNIMELAQEYRGEMKHMEYIDQQRILWRYHMPLGELIIDFYDRLKSSTKWYATMNYDFRRYQESDLVRLDVFINGDKIEAFSMGLHREKAYSQGDEIVTKLKELIPKHLFPIPLQAGIWSKMIARETISAMKKDVLAKCYGWDVSRKRKLLEKQKEWKKKMKAIWSVNVPNDIFMKMMQRD